MLSVPLLLDTVSHNIKIQIMIYMYNYSNILLKTMESSLGPNTNKKKKNQRNPTCILVPTHARVTQHLCGKNTATK